MKDERYHGVEKRDDLRVKYAHVERPKLMIAEEAFKIVDISERGIRFLLEPTLRATLTFRDGESVQIEGKISRIFNNEIAVRLSKGIPPERIEKEK